jgi:hypothetical protein
MNKKGIIILVVIILIAVVGYIAMGKNNQGASTSNTPAANVPAGVTKDTYKPVTADTTDTSLLGRLKNSSVGVSEDGKKVALVNGTGTFTVDGTSQKGTVTLGTIAVEKTKGSRQDVITSVNVKATGSNSTYVVIFQDNGGAALEDKSYALVGEGATITGIRVDLVSDSNVDYIVSVSYRDAEQVNHSKIFVVAAGQFDLAKTISL